MSYTNWKIEHTPFKDNTWSDEDTVELTGFTDPTINTAIGTKTDQFSFKIANNYHKYDSYFKPNDKVVLYRATNSLTHSTDTTEMVGSISDMPEETTGLKSILNIKGKNFSESLAGALVFVDVANKRVNEAIQEALLNAANKNYNFKVTWHEDNPTTKRDLTPFPTLTSNTRFFNKTFKSIIEKYSTNEYTEDGGYFSFVDNNNKLVWRPMTEDIDYTFNAATDIFSRIKIGKDISGVRNTIIVKGGNDAAGNQIQTKYTEWESVSANGQRYHILISESNNARDLIQKDLRRSYGDDIGANQYPTFPFVSEWISAVTGLAITATDDDDYNTKVRAHIKALLSDESKRYVDGVKYGVLTVDIDFSAGLVSWGLGDVIQCNIPQIRELPFILRVKERDLSEETDTYTLVEDEGTIGKSDY